MDQDRVRLLHGDYRLTICSSILTKRSVTVVDWQMITVGLPTRDLAYFLGTSLDSDLREVIENPNWSTRTIGASSTMESLTIQPRIVGTTTASECCKYPI